MLPGEVRPSPRAQATVPASRGGGSSPCPSVAVVGGVDHQCVLGEAHVVQRDHHPADVVVDQRDHAVVVGDHVPHLFVGLRLHAAGCILRCG